MAAGARRIVRFGIIGLAATVLYAVAALGLEAGAGLPPVTASLAAYAVAAVFSYCGHKFVTFMSPGAHGEEAPRFAAVTAAGFGLALAIPFLVTGLAGLPSWLAVALTCAIVPVFNFVVLDRWVFSPRRPLARAGR